MATEKQRIDLDAIQITPLSAKEQISGAFEQERGGKHDYLIDWLTHNAFKAQLTKTAYTYLIYHGEDLVGYMAVNASAITFIVPDAPRNKSKHHVQGLLLGRLYVSSSCQGAGIGDIAIRYVIDIASILDSIIGCAGVIVHSDPGAVGFYLRYGFIKIEGTGEDGTMFFKLKPSTSI